MNNLKQLFKADSHYIIVGMLCLAIGILLNRFATGISISHFLEGMFMGISVPLNLYGIYKVSRTYKLRKLQE